MKVLITAPSLNENENVSGISTVVRQIIEHGRSEFTHFLAGKRDGEKSGISWIASQALLPIRFLSAIRKDDPDIVHINTALTSRAVWRDAVLTAAAAFAGKPVVIAIHGGRYLLSDFDSRILAGIAKGMVHRARVVLVLSEKEKDEIERRWKDIDVRILPNAVPFFDIVETERNNRVPVLIFLGRLHESKGLNEIVKACRSLRQSGFEFRFECYGDGPLKEIFLLEMREILGGRFHYGGVVGSSEKWRRLAEADIFLLPSLYGEGLPMALLEAMAAGCVVLASEMASVASVIDDGSNGYTVEPGNTEQLIGRLKMVIDGRREWADVQNSARATVREKFAVYDHIEKLESIYAEVAGSIKNGN